jgi:hypothetical protein
MISALEDSNEAKASWPQGISNGVIQGHEVVLVEGKKGHSRLVFALFLIRQRGKHGVRIQAWRTKGFAGPTISNSGHGYTSGNFRHFFFLASSLLLHDFFYFAST